MKHVGSRRSKTAPLLVYHEPPVFDDRRFAAVICLLLFFTWFVDSARHVCVQDDWYTPRNATVTLIGSILLYLSGRQLWLRKKAPSIWMLVALAAILVDIGADNWHILDQVRQALAESGGGAAWEVFAQQFWRWPGTVLGQFPAVLVLLLALITISRAARCRQWRLRGWVLMAACWGALACICLLFEEASIRWRWGLVDAGATSASSRWSEL
jgi:hypothetical protein